MRKVITILTFACIIFASCGDSKTTSKEQELELKEQELKGGAKNNMSDSNTDACGCGANDDGQGKHSNKCEYGKKKGSKKGKGYESSYRNKKSPSTSDDGSSSSDGSSSYEDGARHSNNGLSVFPFNSSDVSDKNYILNRRKK